VQNAREQLRSASPATIPSSELLPLHLPSERYCSSQPGLTYPSISLPQSGRRTSAPAAYAGDHKTAWIYSRLRSQSLSSTGNSNSSTGSSNGSSLRVETPTRGLDRLIVGSESADCVTAVIAETFFPCWTAVDNIFPASYSTRMVNWKTCSTEEVENDASTRPSNLTSA